MAIERWGSRIGRIKPYSGSYAHQRLCRRTWGCSTPIDVRSCAMARHVICSSAALLQLLWDEPTVRACLASLHQSDGAAVAIAPLMRKRIGRAQLVARCEKEEGSAGAVRDAKRAQRFHHRLHAVMVGGPVSTRKDGA